MSWATLPLEIREIAQTILTPKQLAAYQLNANGLSERRIAIHCGVSRRAIRDRLQEADVKIRAHPDYPAEVAA